MIQSMIRNDPQFANNPMLQNMLTELAANPQLAAQLSGMMRDPMVRRQVDQLRNTHGGQIPLNNITQMPTGRAPASTNNQPTTSTQSSSQDADQTEEELIAEAIRRSLQDS
jgi:hypothetical protein